MNKTIFTLAALASCGLAAGNAYADGMVGMESETAEAPPAAEAGSVAATPTQKGAARLTASLADEQSQALKREATVKVQVEGMRMVDPLAAGEQAKVGEGHLAYKLDDGPTIETTATSLSFRDLDSGTHSITVMLSGNDHAPLGPSETLQVTIP